MGEGLISDFICRLFSSLPWKSWLPVSYFDFLVCFSLNLHINKFLFECNVI